MTAQLSLPDRQGRTIDDLLSLPDDGQRYEIIDGSLLVSPAAPVRHQVAADRLADMLLLEDGVYREVGTVHSGENKVVDVPFRVELRPAELAGPRRRA